MAATTGLVQRIFMDSAGVSSVEACVFIGPTPTNTEVLLLRRQASEPAHTAAFMTSMLDGLAQALASRREVVASHNDSDAYIFSVDFR